MVYTVDRVDPRKSRAKCKGIKKGAVKQVTVTSPNGFSFTMDMKFSAKGVAMAKITVEASSSSSGSGGSSITGGSGRPPTGGSGSGRPPIGGSGSGRPPTGGSGSGRPPTGGSGSGSGGPPTSGIWDDMCFCVDEDVCNLPMPGGMGGGPQGSGRPPVGGSGSGRPPPGGSGSGRPPPGGSGSGRPPVGGSGSGGSGIGPVGGSGSGNNTGGSGGASGDCKCGLAERRTRIVGGVETEVNEWPWQAGMVWSGSSSVFCGATVISDEWILTASHCVDGTNPAEIQVLLGEHDYWDSGESSMTRMDISEIIMHGDYDSNTVDQDFALLKMARKLDWSANENIRPACLPSAGAGDYDQWMSTVTGWGTTSSGGSTSNVLPEVDVKVISNSECNGAYGGITNNMLCAADASGNGGSDACQGDSGGPLVACGPDGNCGTTTG